MEMWEINGLINKSEERSQEQNSPSTDSSPSPQGRRDLVAERLAYERGEGPEPQPDDVPPSAALMEIMMRTAKE